MKWFIALLLVCILAGISWSVALQMRALQYTQLERNYHFASLEARRINWSDNQPRLQMERVEELRRGLYAYYVRDNAGGTEIILFSDGNKMTAVVK